MGVEINHLVSQSKCRSNVTDAAFELSLFSAYADLDSAIIWSKWSPGPGPVLLFSTSIIFPLGSV